MLIIFGIMASIKSPCAFTSRPMNISNFINGFIIAQYDHLRLDILFLKSRGLTHESFNRSSVVLSKHGGYRVPFCGEIKQRKVVLFCIYITLGSVIEG